MQLIKPIGTFLIHSAYINSRDCGYCQSRLSAGNYANIKSLPDKNSSIYETDVIDSGLPSILSSRMEPPLLSREEKLKYMLSKQETNRSTDYRGSFRRDVEGSEYIDEFNKHIEPSRVFTRDLEPNSQKGQEFNDRNHAEFNKLRDTELGRIKFNDMRNRMRFQTRNYGLEGKYGFGAEDHMTRVYNREHWPSHPLEQEQFKSLDNRKRNKKVYEPIEVRLSLRIQEADLLNKCKFFKKKALKGYPLHFMIRVDGNPEDYMLAAEGILNKARMFLSDACTAPSSLSKSNTTISLSFRPLNKKDDKYRSEHPGPPDFRKNGDYALQSVTEDESELQDMGGFNVEGAFANMTNKSTYATESPGRSTQPTLAGISHNSIDSADFSSSTSSNAPADTKEILEQKPSRFITLNKKKESRWIVKHARDETSSSSTTGPLTRVTTSPSGTPVDTTTTTPPTGASVTSANSVTYTTRTLEVSTISSTQTTSKWKVLNKKSI